MFHLTRKCSSNVNFLIRLKTLFHSDTLPVIGSKADYSDPKFIVSKFMMYTASYQFYCFWFGKRQLTYLYLTFSE